MIDNIEQFIKEIDGTMSIEGMPLDEKDRENIRSCCLNPKNYDLIIQSIVKEYTLKYKGQC